MKKIAIASAIALASITAAHAAPTVYGKVFLTADYTDTSYDDNYRASTTATSAPNDESTFKLNSNQSRIGFKGDDDLTDTTKLIYQLEYQINPDDDSQQFRSRNTYVGLAHNTLGTVLAGRHDTPLKLAQNKVDVFNDSLFDITNAGVSGEYRANNMVAYQSPAIVGMPVSFMAATALSETDTDGDVLVKAATEVKNPDGTTKKIPAEYRDRKVKDNGYSLSLAYDQNGIYLAGAYDKDMGANNVNTGVIDNTWRLVAGLDMGKMNMVSGLTLGALYQQSQYYDNYSIVNNNRVNKASEDEKSWLISGKYKVGATPWAVKAQYVNTTDEKGVKDKDVNEIAVGGEYAFNKATTGHIYAGQISRDNYKDETIVGTGIEYKF